MAELFQGTISVRFSEDPAKQPATDQEVRDLLDGLNLSEVVMQALLDHYGPSSPNPHVFVEGVDWTLNAA